MKKILVTGLLFLALAAEAQAARVITATLDVTNPATHCVLTWTAGTTGVLQVARVVNACTWDVTTLTPASYAAGIKARWISGSNTVDSTSTAFAFQVPAGVVSITINEN